MKREILFRGKDKNRVWYYGDLSLTHCYGPHIITEIYHIDGAEFNVYDHTIIPETVGQFTGLTDKNGVKIFEGDIVIANCAPSGYDKRYIKDHKCEVLFSEINRGWACCIIDHEIGKRFVTGYMSWGQNGSYLEVIGNIHDNPELLNQ